MTEDELWHPGVDPNAETQRAWPDAPGGSIPGQGGPGDGDALLAETRLAFPEQSRAGVAPGAAGRRRPSRRRVLFAAGGVMLLAGGGAATAAAVQGRGRRDPLASGGGAHGPSRGGPSSTHPAGGGPASTSGGAPSASRSASASSSSSAGSPSAPASGGAGSPSSSASGSPSGGGGQVATQPQWYVDDDGPMAIALTMDDGPDGKFTPQVLEIFREHGIKATFNMIGSQVQANLSLVREVSAEGHTITNHTWNHADLSHLSVTQILSQIDRCNDALSDANQHPTIFRAPYGNWSKAVYQACAQRDLKPVGWSVDPRDWDVAHVSTQAIVQNVMKHTHAHDIILEHDGGGDRSHTVAALKQFIPQLLDKGFHFVAM